MDGVYPRGMNWIIKNFLRGLVIVVPIAITVYVVVEAFLRIDRLLELRTPGLGFALTILVIVAVGALAMPGHVAVYLPFSYSMSGGLVIVPRERVERLDADSASMMALVVSGGISRVGARHERAPR